MKICNEWKYMRLNPLFQWKAHISSLGRPMVYEGPVGRYSFTAELRFSLSSAIDREKPSSNETSGPRTDRYYLSATATFLFFASSFHSVESFVHKSEKWRGSRVSYECVSQGGAFLKNTNVQRCDFHNFEWAICLWKTERSLREIVRNVHVFSTVFAFAYKCRMSYRGIHNVYDLFLYGVTAKFMFAMIFSRHGYFPYKWKFTTSR